MNNNIWRFPGNNYTQDQGINTGDMETFASNPISSLAREICQNSVDARLDNQKAIIEFSLFDIKKENVPGIKRLEEEIDSCVEYRTAQPKLHQELKNMKKNLGSEYIHCLRISDTNTKGLEGVTNNDNSPFHLLTKGSGISDKNGSKGGSKGIGKYASFVASNINTVFYSTYNIENERGYIGISKLCSTKMAGTDERTIGIGYFGSDKKNTPIYEDLILDKTFSRKSSGTDVYIIGFRSNENWKKELITQVLDSFISAIYFELLEIKVDDLTINKESLAKVIYDEDLIVKASQNKIKAQYSLLNDEDVIKKEVDIAGYGKVKLFLKGYNKSEIRLATNNCVMIRYPYMKIKSLTKISTVPCSVMCIIEDNELNKILREIENPQHTGWYPERLDDVDLKKEVKYVMNALNDSVYEFVSESLMSRDIQETDIEGAGDYLPGVDIGNDNALGGQENIVVDKPRILKEVKNEIKNNLGSQKDDNSNASKPDVGDLLDGIGDAEFPSGENSGSGGDMHSGQNKGAYNPDGENEIFVKAELSGMSYKYFVANKKEKRYVISFFSQYDEPSCDLSVKYLDDSNKKYDFNILKCLVNGKEIEVKDNKVQNISLEKNKRYILELHTDLEELYSWEVKIYANR